jgi:hypothetical protein
MLAVEVSAIVKLVPATVADTEGIAVFVGKVQAGAPGMPVLSVVGVIVMVLPLATAVVFIV